MPFADRADEELVGIVVVIPARAGGIEEEEPWVFPDERVEVVKHGRRDSWFQEKDRLAVGVPAKPFADYLCG
jgi:hypothetical protein